MTTQAAKPTPIADEGSEPFFEGANEGRLMLMRCRACGAWRMPARDRCDVCWSTDTEWAQASGKGTLYSFGLMAQVYHPGFAADVPYNVSVIELAEGIRMTSNVIGIPNDHLRVGMPLEVTFEDAGDGVKIPKWKAV